jgi:hypothetical protein
MVFSKVQTHNDICKAVKKMCNPQTNWSHGIDTQEEALLHRPLSYYILSYLFKGKQFLGGTA